jgi:hypothetical protein
MHSCDDVISTCHGTLAPHMELVQVQRACSWYDHGTVIGDLETLVLPSERISAHF